MEAKTVVRDRIASALCKAYNIDPDIAHETAIGRLTWQKCREDADEAIRHLIATGALVEYNDGLDVE